MIYLQGKWSFRDLKDFFNLHTGRVYESYLGLNEFGEHLGNKVFGGQKFKINLRFDLIQIYTEDVCIDFNLFGSSKRILQRKLFVREQDMITHITGSAIVNLIKDIK